MGAVSSKSPAERRNTVLRRSQRKSIHGIKSKSEKLAKDIKKFRGTDEDSTYIELKARIETVERELRHSAKNLQPQIRNIYNDALKRTENCYKLLEEKLKENQENASIKDDKNQDVNDNNVDDEVFGEETLESEENSLENSENKRKTVELKLIQVETIPESPQMNKRLSVLKMGVPVMPAAIMEDLNRRTMDMELAFEAKIAEVRENIENIELEISQFVGKKGGKRYNNIKDQLEKYSSDLKYIFSSDEAILEQIKLCENYIGSCLSFLDDKADDDESDFDDVEEAPPSPNGVIHTASNFSPRTMRTTYI